MTNTTHAIVTLLQLSCSMLVVLFELGMCICYVLGAANLHVLAPCLHHTPVSLIENGHGGVLYGPITFLLEYVLPVERAATKANSGHHHAC